MTATKATALLLLCLSAGLYAGLTRFGRFPDKFNYPWKINEEDGRGAVPLGGQFPKAN
jgi:hypothetical protein